MRPQIIGARVAGQGAVVRPPALVLALAILLMELVTTIASAQVAGPDPKYLFREDADPYKEAQSLEVQRVIKPEAARDQALDFKAPSIEFLQEENLIQGTGGVLISNEGLQVQAETAKIDLNTNDAELLGNVLFSWPEGEISADRAAVNIDNELGNFGLARLVVEEGDYSVESEELAKISDTEFTLEKAIFSTCQCSDGSVPWSVRCDDAEVEQEGYAQTYGTTINLHDVPIFYSPYFLFPVKQERQSGLLIPRYGYSSEDGLKLDLPMFVVIDDSTDALIRPFTETRTRTGVGIDYRQVMSTRSNLEGRIIYSDESAREGDLRGTRVEDVFDPTFDDDRVGGYYKQYWQSSPDAWIPSSFVSDIHYISDNLFLREIEDDDIGRRNSRYTTSRVQLRSQFTSYLGAELRGEYNQSIVSDDELTFQRLPEAAVIARRSFRPFGYNPYGIKLTTGLSAVGTSFRRDRGYDGERWRVVPAIKVPHHYKNYVNADFTMELNHNSYSLADQEVPNIPESIITGDESSIPRIGYRLGTAVEKVYHLDSDHPLVYLTDLGSDNQDVRLRRVKHVIEPTVRYDYVPEVAQDNLPLFDSMDRLRQRNLVTYGFVSTLLGRFTPLGAGGDAITELTPEVEDLPIVDTALPLGDLDAVDSLTAGLERIQFQRGNIRQIATLAMYQSYDYAEASQDLDPNRDPFSDLRMTLGLYPSKSFAFSFDGNYNTTEIDFSSWGFSTHFRDDRGDYLRARYTYIDQTLSQIESNLEIVLTNQVKIGGYARYDEQKHELIEGAGALRFTGGCGCWALDLGYRDRINPDKQQVFFAIALKGLGDIVQNIGLNDNN